MYHCQISKFDMKTNMQLLPLSLKESILRVKIYPQISRFLEDDGPSAHLVLLVFLSYLLWHPLLLANFAEAHK